MFLGQGAGGEYGPLGTVVASPSWPFMQTQAEMPYWMRSIGRHLRGYCREERRLPFAVRINLLHLVRIEGEMQLLHRYSGLF